MEAGGEKEVDPTKRNGNKHYVGDLHFFTPVQFCLAVSEAKKEGGEKWHSRRDEGRSETHDTKWKTAKDTVWGDD